MGGISTVDLSLWEAVEGLVMSGKMSKGSGVLEPVLTVL